jgi:ubiquinone/menaquinone biosynthesis C-methylase UbiE
MGDDINMVTNAEWNQSQKGEKDFWQLQNYPIIDIYKEIYNIFDDTIKSTEKESSLVLDVGCGAIAYSVIHGFRNVVLYDSLIEEYLKFDSSKTNIPESTRACYKGTTEDMSIFWDNWYDLIFCLNMLDHVCDMEISFKEICRVLKVGGKLLFSCDLRNEIDECHPNLVTKDFILKLIKDNSLTVEKERYTNHIGFECYQAVLKKII